MTRQPMPSLRAARIRPDTAHGLPRHYVPRKDGVICVTASPSMNSGQAKARQSMQSEVMDCFTAFAMTATLTMTSLFVESEVKQSMISNDMIAMSLRSSR
jgi:hypothetical protein